MATRFRIRRIIGETITLNRHHAVCADRSSCRRLLRGHAAPPNHLSSVPPNREQTTLPITSGSGRRSPHPHLEWGCRNFAEPQPGSSRTGARVRRTRSRLRVVHGALRHPNVQPRRPLPSPRVPPGVQSLNVSAFITHFDNVMSASPAEGHPNRLTRSLDVSLQLPQWAAVRQARADSSDGATGHRARR